MTVEETMQFNDRFAEATEAQWRALAEQALKGGDFEKRLVSQTLDGRRIEPVYERCQDGSVVTGPSADAPWRLAQRVDHPEAAAAAEQALADLEGGANMLVLVPPASRSARGFGMAFDTVADLDASLRGAALEMIDIRLEPAPAGRINAGMLAALVRQRGHAPGSVFVEFGMDPLGSLMTLGSFSADWPEVGRRLADSVGTLSADGFTGPFLSCDVRLIHEAGGTEVDELATALAVGVAYMRALVDAGMPATAAERALSWTVAIDADQFAGIAKLRALRHLWTRVQSASGLQPEPIRIHAETAWRMMTKRDPAVNMLRATLATFTAGIAGADSVTVVPYTAAHGLPDSFARRVARNTQTVLLEESNLWRVADPAAGAGSFEALTNEFCRSAWERFQQFERDGGIVEVLKSGSLQRHCAEMRKQRLKAIANGKAPLTGTSAFPALQEPPTRVLDVAADPKRGLPKLRAGKPDMPFSELVTTLMDGKSRSDVTPGPLSMVSAPPFEDSRLSEPFEALRDTADAAAETGSRPAVFLASVGELADHTARTTWVRNLLASAGIEGVSVGSGFTATGDIGKAFAESGLSVAVICGSDEAYTHQGDATAAALKTAGAKYVYIARKPSSPGAAMTSAGIDGHFYAGQDAVLALGELQQNLGIASV